MKKHITLFLSLAIALSLSSCGGKVTPPSTLAPIPSEYAGKTNPLGESAATEGAINFVSYCEPCHGASGHGDGAAGAALDPKPANLSEVAVKVGDDYLFWRISEGVPGTSMVGWAGVLTEEQIWQVVAYIRTLK